MEQEAREVELVFRIVPKGTYAVSVRMRSISIGRIRVPGGPHA